jgi:hypothetical protein
MNAFDGARMVEARAMLRLRPFIEEQSDGRFVVTDKGRLAPMLQQVVGDVLFNARRDGRLYAVELKAEARQTGNLFLETWSNRNLENRDSHAQRGSNPGWLYKLRADLLFYYFLDTDKLFVMDVFALKRWAFGGGRQEGRLHQYREVRQGKYEQANDTWGRLVPISTLRVALETPVREFSVAQLELLTEAE